MTVQTTRTCNFLKYNVRLLVSAERSLNRLPVAIFYSIFKILMTNRNSVIDAVKLNAGKGL